jgi:hypothetical protein
MEVVYGRSIRVLNNGIHNSVNPQKYSAEHDHTSATIATEGRKKC